MENKYTFSSSEQTSNTQINNERNEIRSTFTYFSVQKFVRRHVFLKFGFLKNTFMKEPFVHFDLVSECWQSTLFQI